MTPPAADPVRVLVTGAHGFVGRRLTAALAARHPGWMLLTPAGPDGGPDELSLDITEADAVRAYIHDHRPDVVVHLAAVAAVTSATRDPRLAWRVNLDGVLNLVLALQAEAPAAHLLFVSSAEVYGASLDTGGPADETRRLQPVNPYAASKAAADILVRQAAAAGLSATVMRPFNHIGPGQTEAFMAPSFAGQIARIEAGLQPPVMSVGSLQDARDFLDVDDVVEAYLAVIDARGSLGRGEIFNVASGRAMRAGEVLDHLLSRTPARIEVVQDPARIRKTTVKSVVGDSTRLRERLGWRPRVAIEDTLDRLLDAKRREVAGAAA